MIVRTALDFSENISIFITPLYCTINNNPAICTNIVTIYNRVMNFALFFVYKSLQIENIIFDGTDILSSDSTTNTSRGVLCANGINSYNCLSNLSLLEYIFIKISYSCSGSSSYNSLIEFVINNQMDFSNTINSGNSVTPQTLVIKVNKSFKIRIVSFKIFITIFIL